MKPLFQIICLSILSTLLFVPKGTAQRLQPIEPNFFERGNEQFERNIQQLQQSQPEPILRIDSGIQQWQPISSQAGQFSVWAPLGIISDDSETVQLGGTSVDFRILSSQTASGKFVVAYADAPDIEMEQLLAIVKDGLVERTAFDISAAEPITVIGGEGESVRLTGESELISAYILLGNDRVYVVGVRESAENAPSEAATRFLSSFNLNVL